MFTVINICIYIDGWINQSINQKAIDYLLLFNVASNALLSQNEASGISSKSDMSELLMFHIKPCVLFFQAKLYT